MIEWENLEGISKSLYLGKLFGTEEVIELTIYDCSRSELLISVNGETLYYSENWKWQDDPCDNAARLYYQLTNK